MGILFISSEVDPSNPMCFDAGGLGKGPFEKHWFKYYPIYVRLPIFFTDTYIRFNR